MLAAALPLALLLADVVSTLRGALDEAAADVYGDLGLALPPTSTTLQRAATALSGVAAGPTLVVCALALVVLAVATVAGRGRWAPARGSRWVGAVLAALTTLTALAAAVGAVAQVSWATGTDLQPSWAVQQAPLLAPMLFAAVFAGTACAALVRPSRW